ncbi:hypothetical protein As57867_019503, partial [Aphanomyces stellatus]
VQVVSTTASAVVAEVQTVTTSATDRNEVQTLTLTGTVVNEIQAVRTSVTNTPEVQTVAVGVTRVNEVQSFSLGFQGITLQSSITGNLVLGLDTTTCSFCSVVVALQSVDVTAAVTDTSDTTGATTMATKLATLANIDTVTVTRATTTAVVGGNNQLTIVFTVTFSGNKVGGTIPLLSIQSLALAPLIPLTTVQSAATRVTAGSQPIYSAGSYFKLYYTCEQYSDPTVTLGSYVGISTACQPTTRLCASCATAFDGTQVLTSSDISAQVTLNPLLQIGPCVFAISAATATQLTVDTTNVGQFCSQFTGKTLDVYVAKVLPVMTNLVMLQTGPLQYPEDTGTVATQFLNSLGKSVAVTLTPTISSTFVGTTYSITFTNNHGTIPKLTCDVSTMVVSASNPTPSCTVARTTTGSMIYGTFTLSLPRFSDGTVMPTNPAVSFDVLPADLQTALQAVGGPAEYVFG